MSSGYVVVESAAAREARLLATARARHAGLLQTLRHCNVELALLGLDELTASESRGMTADEVDDECSRLQATITSGEQRVVTGCDARRDARSKSIIEDARRDFAINLTISADRTVPTPTTADEAVERASLASRADQIIASQRQPDPAIAELLVRALGEPPHTAKLLLSDIAARVHRTNQALKRSDEAQAALERIRCDVAAATLEAELAGAQAERDYLREAVRASLEAIGHTPVEAVVDTSPDALIVQNAAFPQHAIMVRIEDERVVLDPVRVDGASEQKADRDFEAVMCKGLSDLKRELQRRDVTPVGYRHLPPGIAPTMQRVSVRAGKTESKRRDEKEQRR